MNRFFNTVQLTPDDDLFIGIDTHKETYHVAFHLNDAPVLDFVMPSDAHQLVKQLEPVRQAVRKIAYEAGPTGYSLARILHQNRLPAVVAATSKTPRPSAKENKTDRLDSKKLACYLAKGLLKPVTIPTVQQEADRQVCRMRHRQVKLWTCVKQQIKAFLLQHGLAEPDGLKHWSSKSVKELRTLSVSAALRLSLDTLLSDYDYHAARIADIEKKHGELLDQTALGRRIALLETHPGVGSVTARQFATELYHYGRFEEAVQVVKYVGLSPMVYQSGQKSTTGSINRDGKPSLRCTLIQAAWQWIARDSSAKQYFWRICSNNGNIKQKAITAVARKLTVHLWTMLKNNAPYHKEKAEETPVKRSRKTKSQPLSSRDNAR
jgi:transposase